MRSVLSAGIRAKTQFDDHDAVICGWLIHLTKGIFPRADLTDFIEPQVMKPHERSRFERGKIRPQLGMPFVELNVRRFHVDSVFSETGQGLIGFFAGSSRRRGGSSFLEMQRH